MLTVRISYSSPDYHYFSDNVQSTIQVKILNKGHMPVTIMPTVINNETKSVDTVLLISYVGEIQNNTGPLYYVTKITTSTQRNLKGV